MADFIVSRLLDVIVDKVASPLLEKFRDLYSFKDNIKKLQQSLPMIQALLEDARKQQEARKAIKWWLMTLESIAYECEDLLDELQVEMALRECNSTVSNRKQAAGLFLPFRPSDHLFELASVVSKKLGELERIAEKGLSFNLQQTAIEKPLGSLSAQTKETMPSVSLKMYGRVDDKKNLLELLLPNNKGKGKDIEGLPVISIVGIGGIGKTMLVQQVYNDEKVKNQFDLKMWIHVSENFDLSEVMIKMIKFASTRGCEIGGLALLQSQLQDSLSGKRFLLVLDDVWTVDEEEWERFIDLLGDGAEGSRVLVTTRSTKVAEASKGAKLYKLNRLEDNDCWDLFKQHAFKHSQPEDVETQELFSIGKEIINKCGGVPLAAKTLGRLLRCKNKEYWMAVQESELWNLKECQTAILPALRLSYQFLPPHLKQCFAFCSLFPKNHEIYKERMIYIWMAQGLILPDGGNRQLEDVAGDYFDDLLSRSFFQEVQENISVGPTVYKMHDLLHDLARTIGGSDFAILGQGLEPCDFERVHHLSIVCNINQSSLPDDLFEARHLRTLLFMFPGHTSDDFTSLLPVNFVYLRVLDFGGCGIKSLDECALICLRYLDLSNNPIQRLPQTICSLCHLQTLNLFGCRNLLELPSELSNVTSLRHLNIMGCESLTHMPPMIGKLVQLQTLPIYIVGESPSESIAQLQFLNLRDQLHIKNMENIRDADEAKRANMKAKKHLRSLKLHWGRGSSNASVDWTPTIGTSTSRSQSFPRKEDEEDVEAILKGLEPHVHLQNLSVNGYPGRRFPEWNLPNLTRIELINSRRCLSLPILGHLPFLVNLHLQGMNDITYIDEAFYGGGVSAPFPSLKYLVIRDFPHLVNWLASISGVVPFPCLEKLVLDKCPKLTVIAPSFPSIRNLELHHCNAKIMEHMERITSLSSLVFDSLLELENLSGTFLRQNASLESLEIRSCKSLRFLPLELEGLVCLRSLVISCCEKLSDLPPGLHKLKNLELLEINGCHSLELLPCHTVETEGLSRLKTLSIDNCKRLRSFSGGFHCFTTLEHLSVMNCPELTELPDGFGKLTALRSLSIVLCDELAYFPPSLKHATALQSLVIHSCSGLTALPEWFSNFSRLRSMVIYSCENLISLPEGLQRLTSLQHISIQDCQILETLCKRKSIEWQKIAHIPHIYIGSQKM